MHRCCNQHILAPEMKDKVKNSGAHKTQGQQQHGKQLNMEKTCLHPKIYLSLPFSPEWVGVTKNFKVYNVPQVHTFHQAQTFFGYYLPYRQYVCTLFSIVRTWNEWPTPFLLGEDLWTRTKHLRCIKKDRLLKSISSYVLVTSIK